jgi:hypothetical protein
LNVFAVASACMAVDDTGETASTLSTIDFKGQRGAATVTP